MRFYPSTYSLHNTILIAINWGKYIYSICFIPFIIVIIIEDLYSPWNSTSGLRFNTLHSKSIELKDGETGIIVLMMLIYAA